MIHHDRWTHDGPAGIRLDRAIAARYPWLSRAQVAALLEQKGVSRKRMKVASYGASQPYRYNPKHSYAKDRRVEIIPE